MNIDLSQLNQLSEFTRFANTAIAFPGGKNGENKVARANPDNDLLAKFDLGGKGGTIGISENNNDKPRAWFRSKEDKNLNNATRKLFKDTIAKLFGGEKFIPKDVQDTMHIGTFSKNGRPLTAKRINLTKDAIIKYFSEHNETGFSSDDMLRVLDGNDTVTDIQREKGANHLTDTKFSINDDGDGSVKNAKPVKNTTRNDKPINNFNSVKNTAKNTNPIKNFNPVKNANNNASKPKVNDQKKNGIGGKGQKSFGDILAIYNKPGKTTGKGKNKK